jgi:hypothetical protein
MTTAVTVGFEPEAQEFYRHAIQTLKKAKVPFLLGGAYAFQCYTGLVRHTKDLDLFLEEDQVGPALRALARAGLPGEVVFPHWLAKAWHGEYFVDLIYSSGNGIARVDRHWFDHSVEAELVGVPVRLCPAEEMIWSKAFIMERERFDGADVAHLILARAEALDWRRLIDRFADHWRVLLVHLVLFGYIYPGERHRIPAPVMDELLSRLGDQPLPTAEEKTLCRGPLLSRAQYLVDTGDWGYGDARVTGDGTMTDSDVAIWTKGIADDGPDALPTAGEPSCHVPREEEDGGERSSA